MSRLLPIAFRKMGGFISAVIIAVSSLACAGEAVHPEGRDPRRIEMERQKADERKVDDKRDGTEASYRKAFEGKDLTNASRRETPSLEQLGPEGQKREKADYTTKIVIKDAVDAKDFTRLNVNDPSTNRPKPSEAVAAAEFEKAWNCRLERGRSTDFRIIEGNDKGKTVDFMLTVDDPAKIEGLNRNFNISELRSAISDHVKKADIIPIDIRALNETNKTQLMDEVTRLSRPEQQKIVIIRSEQNVGSYRN